MSQPDVARELDGDSGDRAVGSGLDELDPEQRAAVVAPPGPVCILAGAGTGKTRTITHRIAHLVRTGQLTGQHVLAVTFTARAAGEMRTRLRALGVTGVQARTFHAAALRQLRYFAPRVLGGPLPDVVDNKLRLVASAATRCRIQPDRSTVRDLASEIEWAKSSLVTAEDYPAAAQRARREPPLAVESVARVLTAYEEVKASRAVLDFEDMLLVTAYAIEEHRDVADQVRAQYRHFLVDEYQDVNPLQQRLLDAWLGGRDDLCVVGDPNQTIYSFTGARPTYLLEFPSRYPNAAVVRLERDYRSTPQVVGLANRVIGQAAGRLASARLNLVGQRPDGPEPTFQEYLDEPAEAAAVAAACRTLIAEGTPASEIAVLFRTNAQSESYESALADLGISYLLRGGERFFERREVRSAVLLLRGAVQAPRDPEPLPSIVRDVLSSAGWSAQQPPAGSTAREEWESLAALVGLAEELAAVDPEAGLQELVAELEQRAAAQHAPTLQGVTLASLHAAKGLEWDAVFLVGATDGTLPIQHAVTDEQVEEERRLFYVGITRARVRLGISWALARAAGGRRSRRVSRFVQGLVPSRGGAAGASGDGAGSARRGKGRSGPVRCRVCGAPLAAAVDRKLGRCEGCPSDVDEALFERLRNWRGEVAKEAGIPAYVVFTDATLTAIAESRPDSIEALAGISGVGPHKLEKYADAVLALVQGNFSATSGDGR